MSTTITTSAPSLYLSDTSTTIQSGVTIGASNQWAAVYGGNDFEFPLFGYSYTPRSVTNFGVVGTGTSTQGIYLESSGSVTNGLTGTVIAQQYGVRISNWYYDNGPGTVVNLGSIQSTGASYDSAAVFLESGGQVTNASTGVIQAQGQGIWIEGGNGTVVNAGTISGTTDAVSMQTGETNFLTVDPGAVFIGVVNGGNTPGDGSSTIELASGSSGGTIARLGTQYVGFTSVEVDSGAQWTIDGSNSLGAGITLTNNGTLTFQDGTLGGAAGLVNNGYIAIDPSDVTIGSLSGTGVTTIDAGSTLEVTGSIASSATIAFSGSGDLLQLDSPSEADPTVVNFGQGDTIDLSGVSPGDVTYSGTLVSFSDAGFNVSLGGDGSLEISQSGDGTDLTYLTVAAPTDLILDPGSESGVDNYTNINDPTIDGTGIAGDTVTLYNGNTEVGSVIVGDGGTWSITSPALDDGSYSFTATQTDLDDDISAASTALNVTIETSVDAPTGLILDPGSESGVDNYTNVNDPTIDGSGVAGDTVTLYDGTTQVGSATIGDDGSWSIASPGLDDGSYSFTAVQTDLADNTSASSSVLNVTIDTATPDAPGNLTLDTGSDSGVLGDDITNVTDPTIDGTGIAGDTVTLYNGDTEAGMVTVGDDGAWSISSPVLDDGSYTFTATQTDLADNVSSPSSSLVLTIDTATPATPGPVVLDPGSDSGVLGDDITNVTDPTIDGTGTAGDTIELFDGITLLDLATVQGNGSWSTAIGTLADGVHDLTAEQFDVAGNLSATTLALALTIDTPLPQAPANLGLASASDSGVQGDDITNVASPTIVGTGEPDTTITLYNGETDLGSAVVGEDGTWSIAVTSPLAAGANTLSAVASDVAGNMASSSLTVTLDQTVPDVTASVAADGHTLTGYADPDATLTITDGGQTVGTAESNAQGAWSLDPTGLVAGGEQTFIASETNVAGNTGYSAPVTDNVPDPRFVLTDTSNSASSGQFYGGAYTGPVSYLQASYDYSGSDNVVMVAQVDNAYMVAGNGEDAMQAFGGSNVMQAGSGSNWLVGATGSDGGVDTFFLNGQGGDTTWDTLVNFHVGDMVTFWGFDPSTSTATWGNNQGAAGYTGATLAVNFNNGTGSTGNVTFAGLSTGSANLSVTTGQSGGVDYLLVTRIS